MSKSYFVLVALLTLFASAKANAVGDSIESNFQPLLLARAKKCVDCDARLERCEARCPEPEVISYAELYAEQFGQDPDVAAEIIREKVRLLKAHNVRSEKCKESCQVSFDQCSERNSKVECED